MDDGHDIMDMNLTGLDLNREPTTSDQPIHGSTANEMETSHDVIEERIRQLEAVTARARQRQRWRQSRNAVETTYSHGEATADVNLRSLLDRGKGCKRDSSHLVAKALEMDSEVKQPDTGEGDGSFYDCSVCLELAKDPVLTCCGHLFCWSCFYQVRNVDSSSKECPVCKGEVSDSGVTPIYGIGDSESIRATESGLQIPPRPRASRVEGARQQQVTTQQSLLSHVPVAEPTPIYGNGDSEGIQLTEPGLQIHPRPRVSRVEGARQQQQVTQRSLLSHVPVAEALRRIRIRIGAMSDGMAESAGGDHHRVRIHQVSRVLSESATSLSSLSSALNNAERLVEDLESVINNRILGNETRALPVDVGSDLPRPLGVTRTDGETVGPTYSSIVRRRSVVWENFDLDNHHPLGPRRRLN